MQRRTGNCNAELAAEALFLRLESAVCIIDMLVDTMGIRGHIYLEIVVFSIDDVKEFCDAIFGESVPFIGCRGTLKPHKM